LTTLASAIPEILLGAPQYKMGHVTLTTPLLRLICRPYAGTWLGIAYLCTKFDHSRWSRSTDMVGAHQNLNGSRDLTTPLSGLSSAG